MRVSLTRCDLAVIVDAPDSDAGTRLVTRLVGALRQSKAARVTRQLPGRIYAMPEAGTVAALAERLGRWVQRAGCDVAVGDW